MQVNEAISKLTKFRSVDKYEAFHEILPAVIHTTTEQKEIVCDILDRCCTALLQLLRLPKRPTKPVMKKALVLCMDDISIAPVDGENKEFGYQLGWYLAEKGNGEKGVGVLAHRRRGSEGADKAEDIGEEQQEEGGGGGCGGDCDSDPVVF